jgi:O-antigen/teichoic acid export membrane protein
MAETLKGQTFRGSMFMGGATLGLRALTMISSVILARLLAVADFGIVALAGIILSTTSLFSGVGMGLAVIHSRADKGKVAWQAFVVTVISGLALMCIVFLGAPVFAWFLGDPTAIPILQAMSPWILLGALASVPEAALQKELMFGRVSGGMLGSEVLSVIVALTMAAMGFGVWSLVAGSLVKGTSYLFILVVATPRREWLRPKPWDWPLMRDLLSYGLKTMGGGLASFIYSVLDNFIVARTLGKIALGLYSKAYDYTTRSVDSITNVAGAVLFPSYATLQGEPERLARAYLKSLRLLALAVVPISLGLFVTARETIPILLGPQWVPMTAAFEMMCWVSLVKTLSGTTGALFASTGHPEYNFRASLLVLGTMVPLIFLLLGLGIQGVALALLITHILGLLFNVYQTRRLISGALLKVLTAIAPAAAGGVVMCAAVYVCKFALIGVVLERESVSLLLSMVVCGAGSYAWFVWYKEKDLVKELITLALSRAGRKRPASAGI